MLREKLSAATPDGMPAEADETMYVRVSQPCHQHMNDNRCSEFHAGQLEIVEKILTHLKIPMNPVPLPLEHGPVQTQLCGVDPTQLDPQLHLDLEVASATSSTDNDTSDCGARDPPP